MSDSKQERFKGQPTLKLDNGNVLVYVGGPRPYFWIGSPAGKFHDAIDADSLKDFVGPLRRARKAPVSPALKGETR